MALAPAAGALHVHVWQAEQAHVAFLKLRVLVDGALVDVIRFPFDPDGDHQLEQVDDLACGTQYVVFVAPCSVEGDWLGGCGPELSATASTSPCVGPRPPPRPRPPPPDPPVPPRPPAPPAPPPAHTAADRGCKDPQAATFDPGATIDDPSECVDASWGCTLPRAANYDTRANLNDGSCRFDPSVCAVSLTSLPWRARAAGATWPVSANRTADGSRCEIGPAVPYNRCLSLRPPSAKSVDVLLMFQLPLGAMAASVEVGLSPHAGRDGSAEFELRLVTALGDVVASSLAVRARRGEQIPPALLRVELAEALRGTPGNLLQLVVNNDGVGDVSSDLVVWAEPLLYCDTGCPCGGYAGLPPEGDISGGDGETEGATAGLRDDGLGSSASTRLSLATVGVLLLSAGLVFGVLKLGLVVCRGPFEDSRQEEEEEGRQDDDLVELSGGYPDVYPDVGVRQSRIVGEVRISKRPKADERRNLMGREAEEEEDDDEEELQVARL